jgi:hypothetical protein
MAKTSYVDYRGYDSVPTATVILDGVDESDQMTPALARAARSVSGILYASVSDKVSIHYYDFSPSGKCTKKKVSLEYLLSSIENQEE